MHFGNTNSNFEKVIRDSERLAVVTEYVDKTDDVNIPDLKIMLGIDKPMKEDK